MVPPGTTPEEPSVLRLLLPLLRGTPVFALEVVEARQVRVWVFRQALGVCHEVGVVHYARAPGLALEGPEALLQHEVELVAEGVHEEVQAPPALHDREHGPEGAEEGKRSGDGVDYACVVLCLVQPPLAAGHPRVRRREGALDHKTEADGEQQRGDDHPRVQPPPVHLVQVQEVLSHIVEGLNVDLAHLQEIVYLGPQEVVPVMARRLAEADKRHNCTCSAEGELCDLARELHDFGHETVLHGCWG
mmetsp:Transcript_103220/g.308334  ORF Transcript_103220/g.308334 Transcript_103220/m.308334 type:complete len:246 (-) Transcript_103220:96-833(-)